MTKFPTWLIEHLGASAPDILRQFPECLHAAHERARDSQDVSLLTQKNPYGGTLWLAVYDEFVRSIGTLPGASIFRPNRASYSLVVVQETLIYPMRVGSDLSTSLEQIRVRVRPLRREILTTPLRQTIELTFDFAAIADPDDTAWLTEEFLAKAPRFKRVLVVPYISNSDAGLLAAGVGEGRLMANDEIIWDHFELLNEGLFSAAPQAVSNPDAEPRFDTAVLTDPLLRPRARPVANPVEQDERTRAAADQLLAQNDSDD